MAPGAEDPEVDPCGAPRLAHAFAVRVVCSALPLPVRYLESLRVPDPLSPPAHVAQALQPRRQSLEQRR